LVVARLIRETKNHRLDTTEHSRSRDQAIFAEHFSVADVCEGVVAARRSASYCPKTKRPESI
jgi:hypothetical protein